MYLVNYAAFSFNKNGVRNMKKMIGILSVLLLGAGATAAMAQSATAQQPSASASAAASSSEAAAPNDAQIAAIVVAANQVDIDAGKLAKSKAKNKDVKKFAERM